MVFDEATYISIHALREEGDQCRKCPAIHALREEGDLIAKA